MSDNIQTWSIYILHLYFKIFWKKMFNQSKFWLKAYSYFSIKLLVFFPSLSGLYGFYFSKESLKTTSLYWSSFRLIIHITRPHDVILRILVFSDTIQLTLPYG